MSWLHGLFGPRRQRGIQQETAALDRSDAADPAVRPAGWRELAPLTPVLTPLLHSAAVSEGGEFRGGLSTLWHQQSLLRPLRHEADLQAPAGIVGGIVTLHPATGEVPSDRPRPVLPLARPAVARRTPQPLAGAGPAGARLAAAAPITKYVGADSVFHPPEVAAASAKSTGALHGESSAGTPRGQNTPMGPDAEPAGPSPRHPAPAPTTTVVADRMPKNTAEFVVEQPGLRQRPYGARGGHGARRGHGADGDGGAAASAGAVSSVPAPSSEEPMAAPTSETPTEAGESVATPVSEIPTNAEDHSESSAPPVMQVRRVARLGRRDSPYGTGESLTGGVTEVAQHDPAEPPPTEDVATMPAQTYDDDAAVEGVAGSSSPLPTETDRTDVAPARTDAVEEAGPHADGVPALAQSTGREPGTPAPIPPSTQPETPPMWAESEPEPPTGYITTAGPQRPPRVAPSLFRAQPLASRPPATSAPLRDAAAIAHGASRTENHARNRDVVVPGDHPAPAALSLPRPHRASPAAPAGAAPNSERDRPVDRHTPPPAAAEAAASPAVPSPAVPQTPAAAPFAGARTFAGAPADAAQYLAAAPDAADGPAGPGMTPGTPMNGTDNGTSHGANRGINTVSHEPVVPAPAELDRLADQLYGRLREQLSHDLLVGRERAQRLLTR